MHRNTKNRQQPAASVTTNYTVDLASGLTQVLADGTNTYLYGLGRIGEQQPGGWRYHLGDALGSVRQLVDASGEVRLAQNYEPYGDTRSSQGEGSSAFQFTGEMRDATGLTYLRARYLDSGVGRFLTQDTWVGDYSRPLSLNGWNYVEANPTNRVDPTGYIAWSPDGQLYPCVYGGPRRYCHLNLGGYLDEDHYGYVLPGKIMKELYKNIGNPWWPGFILEQSIFGPWEHSVAYTVNLPKSLSDEKLKRIGLGIYLDFQIGYEQAQAWDPRTWFGGGSSFSNEDLPTDYLSFVAYVHVPRLTYEKVVELLGGGFEYEEKPAGYSGGALICSYRCDCGVNNPRNRTTQLKVRSGSSYRYIPYPDELRLTPIGPGDYWVAGNGTWSTTR